MSMNPADEVPRFYDRRQPPQGELLEVMHSLQRELAEAKKDRAEVKAEMAELRGMVKPMADFLQQRDGAAWAAKASAAVFLFLIAISGAVAGLVSFLKMHLPGPVKP